MELTELDRYLLPVLDKLGPWTSRDDLYRESPWQQITRDQVAAWTASAEDRGLIASRVEAGFGRRYALTKGGETALPLP